VSGSVGEKTKKNEGVVHVVVDEVAVRPYCSMN
jgi:hypothetical protein